MLSLTKTLLSSTPYEYFTDTEVITALGPDTSPAKRHGLVKRALAKGEIVGLKRGIYIFSEEYRRNKVNLFELADLLYHPSYISLESALSYHGAIPEAVYGVTCISTKRKKSIQTVLGRFEYFSLSKDCFYQGVERVFTKNKAAFFIASIEKSLLDYLYVYKKSWSSAKALEEDLRFNEDLLSVLDLEKLLLLGSLYKSKRVDKFTKVLAK